MCIFGISNMYNLFMSNIKNERDNIYSFITELMKDLGKATLEKEYIEKRFKIDALMVRLSDKHISTRGVIDFKNTAKFINDAYILANIYSLFSVRRFICNDIVSFFQSIRMFSWMQDHIEINSIDILNGLHIELRVLGMCYFKARDTKWKSFIPMIIQYSKNDF